TAPAAIGKQAISTMIAILKDKSLLIPHLDVKFTAVRCIPCGSMNLSYYINRRVRVGKVARKSPNSPFIGNQGGKTAGHARFLGQLHRIGQSCFVFGFIARDFVLMLERQSDIVQAEQQKLAAVLVKVEAVFQSVLVGHLFVFQIYRQLVAFMLRGSLEQLFHLLLAKLDRQNAVFEAVVVENVCKRRSDNDLEAVI